MLATGVIICQIALNAQRRLSRKSLCRRLEVGEPQEEALLVEWLFVVCKIALNVLIHLVRE